MLVSNPHQEWLGSVDQLSAASSANLLPLPAKDRLVGLGQFYNRVVPDPAPKTDPLVKIIKPVTPETHGRLTSLPICL